MLSTTIATLFVTPLLLGCALGAEYRITNASELLKFSNSVNAGTDYAGTTVTLDADIDFTSEFYGDRFYPIGSATDKTFAGTFDGQGHVISNFRIGLFSYDYVGLFGCTEGATIRNVVMDATNHIDNYNTKGGSVFMAAGLVCHCRAAKRACVVENNVNMARITFTGTATTGSADAYVGGIVGKLTAVAGTGHAARVANCANYGLVSHTGSIKGAAYIGGIVGDADGGGDTAVVRVLNSASYGPVTNAPTGAGEQRNEYVGGVAGEARHAAFENCLAAAPINDTAPAGETAGCVAGNVGAGVAVTHCFWTAGALCAKATGGSGAASVTGSSLAQLNAETVAALDEFAEGAQGLTGWATLVLNGGKVGSAAGEGEDGTVVTTPRVALTPSKVGSTFLYWCTDEGCEERYDPRADNVTALYAKFEAVDYTLRLDLGNGTVLAWTLNFGDEIAYPQDLDRKGYFMTGWSPSIARMPAEDTAVKAEWAEVQEYVVLTLGGVAGEEAPKRKEFEATVAKYAAAGTYEVVDFRTEGDATKAVIKFVSVDEAEKFAKGIQRSADAKDIKEFGFLSKYDSLAFSLQPLWFILSLF